VPSAGALARRAKAVRPIADELRRAQEAVSKGGLIAVLPGDLAAADALRDLLGLPSTDLPAGEGLLVFPAVAGAEVASHARALVAHQEAGGRALALLAGTREERERLERELVAEGVRVRRMAHTPALSGAQAGAALDAVVRALGDEAPAAAQRLPKLRPAVSEILIADAALRAGVVAAAPLAAIDMPVITLIQARLVAQLAAAYDLPLGPERAVELAPILVGGYAWRGLSRLAQSQLPAPAALVRGALASAVTLGIGVGADAYFRSGHAPSSLDGLRASIEGALRRRAAA
jgi:uncharacterized protein (DUF697 family)